MSAGLTEREALAMARRNGAVRKLEELEPYFDQEEKALMAPIFEKLKSGQSLEPEAALQGWIRLYELRRLRGRLERMSEGKA